jgi:methyltransferase FkbM-like protein
MDVEGCERECLLGAEQFFKRHRPPLVIAINHASAQSAGYNVSDLIAVLGEYGYTRFAELDALITTGETAAVPDIDVRATFW